MSLSIDGCHSMLLAKETWPWYDITIKYASGPDQGKIHSSMTFSPVAQMSISPVRRDNALQSQYETWINETMGSESSLHALHLSVLQVNLIKIRAISMLLITPIRSLLQSDTYCSNSLLYVYYAIKITRITLIGRAQSWTLMGNFSPCPKWRCLIRNMKDNEALYKPTWMLMYM